HGGSVLGCQRYKLKTNHNRELPFWGEIRNFWDSSCSGSFQITLFLPFVAFLLVLFFAERKVHVSKNAVFAALTFYCLYQL
ncbi:MAG: hypothetical protein J1E79_03875, partial [Rikenella sp.]|nr:hypothetical protein [Rikenella sp.]